MQMTAIPISYEEYRKRFNSKNAKVRFGVNSEMEDIMREGRYININRFGSKENPAFFESWSWPLALIDYYFDKNEEKHKIEMLNNVNGNFAFTTVFPHIDKRIYEIYLEGKFHKITTDKNMLFEYGIPDLKINVDIPQLVPKQVKGYQYDAGTV